MTKEDLKIAFGSLANAARVATEHGEKISPQVINAWEFELLPRWAAFFYLIQQKRQLTLDMVFNEKEAVLDGDL